MTEAREWWALVFSCPTGVFIGQLQYRTREQCDEVLPIHRKSVLGAKYRLHIRLKPSKETK